MKLVGSPVDAMLRSLQPKRLAKQQSLKQTAQMLVLNTKKKQRKMSVSKAAAAASNAVFG